MTEYAHGVFFDPGTDVMNWNTDTLRPHPDLFNLIVSKYDYQSFDIRTYEHLGPMINFRKDKKGMYPLQFTYKGEDNNERSK